MKVLYNESQKFTQWWLWLILFSFPLFAVYPFDLNNLNFNYIFISIAILLFFYFLELRIFITEEALYYQFFPIHMKKHQIKFTEIKKVEAVKYKPIIDYGGWGIKHGFNGKAYNVSGNLGVRIYLSNGTNILFGSKKHKEFEIVLMKAMKR
jgi:hypothetical protein|tara:strand:+ start:360 stop:812 length:453 start_codon:yes stop_codon:yes gene_type:complete